MTLVEIVGAKGIGIGIAAVAFQIVLLVLSARAYGRTRRVARSLTAGAWSASARPLPLSRFLVVGPAIPVLLVLGEMIYAVQRSRGTMLQSVMGANSIDTGGLASLGLVQELGAILGGMFGLVLPLPLGAMAAGLAISAHHRRAGLAHAIDLAGRDREAALAWTARPGSSAPTLVAVFLGFVVLGLGPVIAGGISGTWREMQALRDVSRADPAEKIAIYQQAEQVAGTILERGYRIAVGGVVCAAIGAAILLWFASPSRARARVLGRLVPEPSPSGGLAVTGAILAAAAISLFALARPMKRENETPWPSGSANDRLDLETPGLEGPDGLELAPLVGVSTTGLTFDRAPQDAAGMEASLRAYRANFALLHPGEPAPREILFACAPSVGSDRVLAAIEIAHRSGFDGIRFVFESAHQVVRPVIGTVTLRNVTAARASMSADGAMVPAGTESIRLDQTPTCAQLAARVVELRRTGRSVLLPLPPAPADRHQPEQE